MLSGGGGGVVTNRSSYRPFFTDKHGKARHVGGQYDNKASFIERTTVEDAFDVPSGPVNRDAQQPLLDTPELRLVAAVFEDAARVLALSTTRANDHLKRQALSWVEATVESVPGFSFVECCRWLRLDEDWMREQFLRLATRNKAIGRRYGTIVRKRAQGSIAAALLLLLVATPARAAYSLLDFTPDARTQCLRRCDRKFPEPSPSAAPTRTPGPTGIAYCPDGVLNRPASQTDPWFGTTVDVPQGVTMSFCAPVTLPLVKGHPGQITFSWYDVSDQDCGALNVHVDAVDPPVRPRGGSGWSSSGQYVYYAKVGERETPEQTAPGVYVVTVTGGPSSDGCSRFRIAWKAS
jgi:hypothetical protein